MSRQAVSLVYNPAEISTLGTEYLEWKRTHREFGVPFFAKSMPNVLPMFPGEVMSIIARPGHAKTSIMMFWARQRAKWLKENGHSNRVVVYATWEQSIEELHSFYIAAEQKLSVTRMASGNLTDDDWNKVAQASAQRISEPLWFIGHSTMRRSGRQPITTDTLAEAIESIQGKEEYEVDCVYVDYLQRIHPIGGFDNPTMAYSKIMDGLKNFALGFGVPMVVGVQASRDVEELKIQIPEMHHAQWTSNIEQSSDRVLSVVRPRRYKKEGEKFGSITVQGNSQMLVNVLKQKMGEANFAKWLSFNPMYNALDENEIKYGGV